MGLLSLIFGALIARAIATDTESPAMARTRQSPELSVYRVVADTMRLRYPNAQSVMVFVDTLTVPGALVSLELARAMHVHALTSTEMQDCTHLSALCPLPQDSTTSVIRFWSSQVGATVASVSVMVTTVPPLAPNYFRPTRRSLGSSAIFTVTLKRVREDWTVSSVVITGFGD